MADVNDLNSSLSVKVAGAGSTGSETNFVEATAGGGLHTNLRDAAGVEIGTVSNPISSSVTASVLPTGAATAALQTQPGVDIGDVTINNAAGASAVNIQDGGNSITVDGPLTDTQLRATAVPVSESPITPTVVTGSMTATNQTVVFGSTLGLRNITVTLSGTWSAAVRFEGLNSAGVWESVHGTALNESTSLGRYRGIDSSVIALVGSYIVNPIGFSSFRILDFVHISGTVEVSIRGSNLQHLNYVMQGGVWEVARRDGFSNTYSAAITGLVAANSATDIFTIAGTLTNNIIKITRIGITATQTTATNRDIQIIRRSTLNTGGTSTVLTNVNHSGSAASNATVRAYTVNPAALGTLTGLMRSQKLLIPTATTIGQELIFDFGEGIGKALTLTNTTDMICVNLNGVTSAGNSFNIWIEWTEKFNQS